MKCLDACTFLQEPYTTGSYVCCFFLMEQLHATHSQTQPSTPLLYVIPAHPLRYSGSHFLQEAFSEPPPALQFG